MAARRDAAAVHEDVDVVPVREAGRDRAECRLIGGAEILESLIREDHSPSKRIVGAIALEDDYLVRRGGLLEKQGRVETGWTTADDDDFQAEISVRRGDIICLKQFVGKESNWQNYATGHSVIGREPIIRRGCL